MLQEVPLSHRSLLRVLYQQQKAASESPITSPTVYEPRRMMASWSGTVLRRWQIYDALMHDVLFIGPVEGFLQIMPWN
jgi:hypothetical protein